MLTPRSNLIGSHKTRGKSQDDLLALSLDANDHDDTKIKGSQELKQEQTQEQSPQPKKKFTIIGGKVPAGYKIEREGSGRNLDSLSPNISRLRITTDGVSDNNEPDNSAGATQITNSTPSSSASHFNEPTTNRPASRSFPKDDISKQPSADLPPITRPHSHSVGSKHLFVRITFPWNDGSGGVYKVKKFNVETTVGQAARELNDNLPEAFKSEKNKLHFNGEPLDPHRFLSSYKFQSSDKLLFTRDPQYEFALKDDPTKEILVLDPNVKIFEVIKKLVVWIYGSIPANEDSTSRNQNSYRLSKKLGAMSTKGCGLRLMEQKHLADYAIRKSDILELVTKVKSSSADDIVIEVVVRDAPVEDKVVEAPEEDKKEKSEKPASPKLEGKIRTLTREDSGVGSPYNVVHKSHVDFDYQWTGKDIVEAFEFKEKLGQGGYGAVYKAQHKETGFTMAVKVLAISGPGRADLQKEIDVLKKCRCPNVLSYYGTILRDNEIWILMDHCGVGSVKDLMKACVETLDEEQISMVTAQVLKGLAYLHAKGIVHMDVKAANILLTEEGSVKLADFGVSQQLQNASEQSDILIGSPLWMAPEIILRNPYNFKADTWSLGITLIEMAEGRPPNRGVKNLEGLAAIPKMPPPTVSNPRAWTPVFQDFLAKCLTKDPNERPSAMDLLSHPFIWGASGPSVLNDLIKQSMAVKEATLAQERKAAAAAKV